MSGGSCDIASDVADDDLKTQPARREGGNMVDNEPPSEADPAGGREVGEMAAERPRAPWLKRNANLLAVAAVLFLFAFPRVSPFDSLNYYLLFFQRLSEWSVGKLERLFRDYGYYVVFLGVLLENSMFLGLLVPGAVVMILAGLAAQNGAINIWFVLALAVAATILGDTISYFIGRLGWTRALERGSFAGMMEKARQGMASNHRWIILVYHWAGYSRVVGPAAAGLFRIPYRRWAPLDYAGGALWVFGYTGLGVLLGVFGLEFGDTKAMVRALELFFTAMFVAIIAVAIYRQSRGGAGRRDEHPASVTAPVDDR
jgi:membrane-associated protein